MTKYWTIMFISVLYFISENIYFGWNAIAQSSSEVIADGICLIIFAMAVLAEDKCDE